MLSGSPSLLRGLQVRGAGLSRPLQSRLFGAGALDPAVISLVVVQLGLVALVACVVPAMRVARIEPVRALTDL